MKLVDWLIQFSVTHRLFVLIGTLVFIGIGSWSFTQMTFDAFPDLTNVQVQVLTASPGMSSEEVERLVTLPIERSLGNLPGSEEVRSLSRTGISAITIVFEDGTDIWRARQLVQERLDMAQSDIPESAGRPEIAPPSTGLGEVYQFTLSSDRHTSYELYRIFERDVASRLRTVDGVVEVNAWGGGSPQINVLADPFRLAAHGITLKEFEEKIELNLGMSAGGARAIGDEQILVRGVANPQDPSELEEIVIKQSEEGVVLLRDVAEVMEESALTVGLGSADGQGEVIFVLVQLLAGEDALQVVRDVRERSKEVQASLPEGVEMKLIYDREKLVGSTLYTVSTSLLEGGMLVIIVLFLLLGDLRAGLLVASVIPMAMLGAFTGMNFLGFSGNLMSLGAIDFGLIVDGTIVVTESIVALSLAKDGHLGKAVIKRAQSVSHPVLFGVGILILVYLPILLMWGTEGKLFRPMALTVLLALTTALLLSFTFVPAMASLIIKPKGEHHTWLMRILRRAYEPVLRLSMGLPMIALTVSAILLAVSVYIATHLGIEFVPQLQEGDIVVQTGRLPSLNPEQALRESSRIESLLMEFPEVERVASRTGAPALATDPMGLEEADILVRLKPREMWRPGLSTEDLVSEISAKLEAEAPGAEYNFTQPIEMRFNELLEGITADVGIKVYGPDLATLMVISQQIASAIEDVEGAADVTRPIIEGVPMHEVRIDEERLGLYDLEADEVLGMVAAIQRGTEVGQITRGLFRDPVVVKLDMPSYVPFYDVPLVLDGGETIPLSAVASVERVEVPTTIRREQGSRRVLVTSNVRGS